MDEATASIDYETDELSKFRQACPSLGRPAYNLRDIFTTVSKTIREEFADSTLLTIAHRLATIVSTRLFRYRFSFISLTQSVHFRLTMTKSSLWIGVTLWSMPAQLNCSATAVPDSTEYVLEV